MGKPCFESAVQEEKGRASACPVDPRILFYLLLFIATSAFAAFFATADIHRIVRVLPDDAAYYAQVARNVADGNGLTFDGISRTNGFQPLWLALLVPLHALVHGSPELLFRFTAIQSVLVVALSGLILFRVLRALLPPIAALGAALFATSYALLLAVNGMESGVVVLSVSVLFAHGWHARIAEGNRPGPALLFGALLGVVMLSRLDSVFLVAAVCAALCMGRGSERQSARVRGRRLALVGFGLFAVVAPYLLANRIFFGALMPISGQLKSTFPVPHPGSSLTSIQTFGKIPIFTVLLDVGYLLWFGLRRAETRTLGAQERYLRSCVAVLGAGVILHFLHEALFMKWAVMSWHFMLGIPFVGGVFAVALAAWARRGNGTHWTARSRVAMACLALLTGVQMYRHLTSDGGALWHVRSYDTAVWIRANTPEGSVLAMKDAGILGYFSQRGVVNLDGVVNDMDYQHALADRRLGAYFHDHGVSYLVQHAFLTKERQGSSGARSGIEWSAGGSEANVNTGGYERVALRFLSRRYGTMSDPIKLLRSGEVFRSEPYEEEKEATQVVVWALGRDSL